MKAARFTSALALGAFQVLTLASQAQAQSTGFVSSAGVTVSSTATETFVTGTAQSDKIALTLPLATKYVKVNGVAGADELAFGTYSGPESFQALVTDGRVILWERHATGTQLMIENVAYISFNNGRKLYQVGCNDLTLVASKSSTATAPACDTVRVTKNGYNVSYVGSNGNDTITVPLSSGLNITVDGLTGENTVVFPGYLVAQYFSVTVNNSVVTLRETHSTGAQISLTNVKYISFGSGSSIYQVTPNGLVLVAQYGQTVPQTDSSVNYQNWLR